jgi:hypothetical protein
MQELELAGEEEKEKIRAHFSIAFLPLLDFDCPRPLLGAHRTHCVEAAKGQKKRAAGEASASAASASWSKPASTSRSPAAFFSIIEFQSPFLAVKPR